jgi:hypothetical protein
MVETSSQALVHAVYLCVSLQVHQLVPDPATL